uniref:Potassium two pore domain channel subfamily K member 16 n=1 Tax=Neolamprologus brichardi TaxID=32507 RepID=A0A3Q4H081_NEOBR
IQIRQADLSSAGRLATGLGCLSWTALLALAHFIYLLAGATIFRILEREAENYNRNHFLMEKLNFLANYTCLDGDALEYFVKVILYAKKNGVNPSGNSTNPSNWDFSSSFFFASTVITTIGYGNLSPSTVSGQIFCVFFALFGIPLNIVVLNRVGKYILAIVRNISDFFEKKSMALFFIMPMIVFKQQEGWTYAEAIYYCFISLSTIGFGDFVADSNPDNYYPKWYSVLIASWIFFGMAWLALVINHSIEILERLNNYFKKQFKKNDNQDSVAHRGLGIIIIQHILKGGGIS